jgi:ABC-type sulfate/molybdate transport systems ATPase subunit
MAKPFLMTDSTERNADVPPVLSLHAISKSFRGREILNDVSLNIDENEFVVLLGASGSGKSTLLKIIAGLEAPDRGELRIRGTDARHLQPNQRDCAFSFQSNACYDHWTVHQNLYHSADPDRMSALSDWIDAMELRPILNSKPPQLSGGELGRVSLLRSLASRKHFLLLDEPLAQLNPRFRSIAKEAITKVHRERNHTTFYVTHDLNEAMLLADRIVFLTNGNVANVAPPRAMFQLLLASNEEYASAGVPRSHLAIRNGRAVLPQHWKVCSIRSSGSDVVFVDSEASNESDSERLELQLLRCRWGAGYWELSLSNPNSGIHQTRNSSGQRNPESPPEDLPENLIVHVIDTPWLPKQLATQLQQLEDGNHAGVTIRILHEGTLRD